MANNSYLYTSRRFNLGVSELDLVNFDCKNKKWILAVRVYDLNYSNYEFSLTLSSCQADDYIYEIKPTINAITHYPNQSSGQPNKMDSKKYETKSGFIAWDFSASYYKTDQVQAIINFDFKAVGYSSSKLSSNSYLNIMNNMLDDAYTDVILKTDDGQEVRAHRGVLAAASDVFKTMFTVDMKEKLSQEVSINDFQYKTMKSLIDFIYNGYLDKESDLVDDCDDHLLSLIYAADKYNNLALKETASLFLVNRVNETNVINLFSTSCVYNLDSMKEVCFNFLTQHKHLLDSVEWKQLDPNIFRKFFEESIRSVKVQ